MINKAVTKNTEEQISPNPDVQITLRLAQPDDGTFLCELYSSTRREELSALGWDTAQQDTFLKFQFTAQRRHYEIAFPDSDHRIVLRDENPIGRILVFTSPIEMRLVDIALLPEYRGRGIGEGLLRDLLDAAKAANKPVTLHVAKISRAASLYRRLGFSIAGDAGTDYKMEWRAPND